VLRKKQEKCVDVTLKEDKHMTTFTIDADNKVTAHASAEQASLGDVAGLTQFESQANLAQVSKGWPMSRLVGAGCEGNPPMLRIDGN
jgi:hypothetical protein